MLVVKDAYSAPDGGGGGTGALFGAYLTDAPHPAPHYYGTGECFLWRASVLPSTPLMQATQTNGGDNSNNNSNKQQEQQTPHKNHDQEHIHQPENHDEQQEQQEQQQRQAVPSDDLLELAGLPLPPSANTENLRTRSTTLRSEKDPPRVQLEDEKGGIDLLEPPSEAKANGTTTKQPSGGKSGASTPDRIRFKAFPYSGENDYMIFCETGFLSVGAGYATSLSSPFTVLY